jgi:phytoene synthase
VAQLHPECRAGINAARFIYAEIGRVVRRANCDSVSGRAVVPGHRKAWLLLKSYMANPQAAAEPALPAMPGNHFLVEAVAASNTASNTWPTEYSFDLPWWKLRARALWVIDLFERMERRDRGLAPGVQAPTVHPVTAAAAEG